MVAVIAIEGCDNVGKTTLIKRLRHELDKMGVTTCALHFPRDDTTYGKHAIDMIFDDNVKPSNFQMHLLFALDHINSRRKIDALSRIYDVVFLDRSIYSFMVYGAANGIEPELTERMIKKAYKPHYGILIDRKPYEVRTTPEDIMEVREVQTAAYDIYKEIITEDNDNWVIIKDVNTTIIKELAEEIEELL